MDDGYRGTNFDRLDWKRLTADIEEGNIGCVIVKDMSRIGRNYLEVGFYTEVLFREKGVRFIAISNGVDSSHSESNEFAPFLNIMNEWYVRDTSRKIKSVLRNKGMEGKHLTSNAIYGYKKDPEDNNHWLVDEEASNVDKFISLVHKYTDFSELTTPMIHEFIDRIEVHEADKSTGERTQEIDIYLKYVGKLDVPMPETPIT